MTFLNPLPPVDALIFDFGGVLVDIDFSRVFAAWAAYAGVASEAVAARFRFDAAYAAHEKGEIEALEFFAALRKSLVLDISDAQFLAGWNEIFVGEIPGMRKLLTQVADKYPLYLFSNTNTIHKQFFVREYEAILAPFQALYFSSELGMRKPDSEAFHAIAARIGARPERLAFFDDMHDNVAGARTAGLKAFHVRGVEDILIALREGLGIVAH